MDLNKRGTGLDSRVARLLDANLDRAREGLRVVEDWCRFGLDRDDLVITLKDWRQRLGALHCEEYKQARSTETDLGAGLEHPVQLDRHRPDQVVAANCARVQEALRVLEEFARNHTPALAQTAANIRYGLYDLEVTCLNATRADRRRSRLLDARLCLLTSPSDDMINTVELALRHGVELVQYREKSADDRQQLQEAQALADLCRRYGALFIVNDRIDLALAVDADGVHLGQGDLPTDVARRLIGAERLLGRSTHNLAQVQQADSEGCDYLGLGPVFSTAVKPDKAPIDLSLLSTAAQISQRPVFAIGGIDVTKIPALIEHNCRRIAVIGAIMNADDPAAATQALLQPLARPQP
ncbi:thiamine phosphate synthase [Parasynechococcus sp.]|jgi:thiamine-phosphate pyrophosphorylase|uniref:thiamine phosphate synthase n=1 Tax=Parasynechococcus sp. TaxID=3101203 RepID=UPI0037037FE7